MIGKTISHYKIIEKLGSGGMGVVYKAQDLKLDRFVALKFLPPHLGADDEEKKRFIQEARAASVLDHPNICTIHEIDENEDGQLFIAMAYYEGATLKDKIKQGPIAVDEALDIITQIARGLAKAHEKGIVHRDMKPANIIVTTDGVAKIVDFGLAKLVGTTRLTKTGTTMGTAAYMSPEQVQGIDVDQRTDIWSLGVIFYEMLTGLLPFQADYEQALIYCILNEEPQPLRSSQSDLPPELEHIIQKLLSKEVNLRYASVTEFLEDLESLRSGTPMTPVQVEVSQPQTPENSVAVLDFANITGNLEVDWLSGGIAETVTVDLQKISSLRVVSREKVSKALKPLAEQKITEEQIIDLGGTLSVRWIVWGGFQKMGSAIRITAHFTDISTGELLGSAKVDGTMDDVFKLQDQIITSLMATLNLEISDSEIKKIETPETIEVEAYEYYAKGRQLFNQFGNESFEQAQQLFEKAVEVDPKYAMAHSGLGSIHIFRFIAQTDPRDLDIGISHLQKAIKYDPDLADPYPWLAYACVRKQQLDQAIKAGLKGIDLDPDNFHTYYFLSVAYLAKVITAYETERYSDAVLYMKKCIEIQPNFEPAHQILAWIYMLNGQYEAAKVHLEKAVAIEESEKFEGVKFVGALTLMGNLYLRQQRLEDALNWYRRSLDILEKSDHLYSTQFTALTYWGLGNIDFSQRRYDEALKNYKRACEVIEKHPKKLGIGYFLVYAYIEIAKTFHKLGMRSEANQKFQDALKLFQHKKGYNFSLLWSGSDAETYYAIASYYALLNRQKDAIESLQKAIDCGFADLPYIQADEDFDSLRNKPEFQRVVQNLRSRKPVL